MRGGQFRPFRPVDGRWMGGRARVGMPFAQIENGSTTCFPPPVGEGLMARVQAFKSVSPADVLAHGHGRLLDINVVPSTVAHQNPACFPGKRSRLPVLQNDFLSLWTDPHLTRQGRIPQFHIEAHVRHRLRRSGSLSRRT